MQLDKRICLMIIKFNFAAAGAGAPGGSGTHQGAGSPPFSTNSTPAAALPTVLFPSGAKDSAGNKMSNIIDSGIRNTSEFFPEAA